MEFYLSKIVSEWMLPPGSIILLFIVAILAWKKYTKIARYILITATTILFLLSFPPVANLLNDVIETYPALSEKDIKTTKAQAIVILGGGRYRDAAEYGDDTVSSATLERLRYGVRVSRLNGLPILVTGGTPVMEGKSEGELMALVLINEYETTPKWVESASRTTQQNAQMSRELLAKSDIKHILLVTHAGHMIRAKRMFEQYGLTVTPAPTRFNGFGSGSFGILDLLPNSYAFQNSYFALHEILGVVWYAIAY